ncbi:hypothetical protein MKZ38_004367 [Zalerion maritima]|uniref:Major facilitator superfamily (MFS) profile domain-containing protein n=1 Tax=Zalerion maritima TaxID=339359 RepID=A0AAD5RM46_9PEZI|nr:hypothetical protein MKZ38_004367 [Zalerion maritima]
MSSRPGQGSQSTSLLTTNNRPTAGPDSDSDRDDEEDYDYDDSKDDSSWTDTGDIALQLDEEDPLRDRVAKDESLASVLKQSRNPRHSGAAGGSSTHHHSGKKRVRYQEPPSNLSSPRAREFEVDKEAIEVPDSVSRRTITRAERLIAQVMGSNPIHGLTGKPLIYFTSIFVSLGVFLFGYDQGVMSGIITGEFFIDYFDYPSKAKVGTMVAILEIGAFISSLVVGRLGDIIGRRRTIFYGSCIFFVGGALQTFSTSMTVMMLGRIIAGLGVGMLSTIVPVYQSEISPPHSRGKLACIEFSGNIIGYASSVWVDYFCGFIKSDLSWRVPLLMQCVIGALLGLGSFLIVESPRWLLDNDHDEEGMVVIANLYGGGDIHNPKAREEYRDIKMGVLIHRQEGERSYREMFKRYKFRVLIAMSAQMLAQLNGINVISYYAPYVFEAAGWSGHSAVLMTGFNALTYLASTIPPWYIVDKWGRRPILLSGAVMMAISLSLISYFIFLNVEATPTMVVLFVMIYNAAFGYSWGPIPWLYPPEILPLSIRSKGASLSTATNWAFNWLVGEMTPILQEWIKWRLYLVHAFFCATSFIVVYFLYPETCGVRLEDMNSIFGDASTTVGTPSLRGEETGSLMRPGSPVGSVDYRGRPVANIPGLSLDGPDGADGLDGEDNDAKQTVESGTPNRGVGGWISRVVGRERAGSGSSSQARYAPLGQREE